MAPEISCRRIVWAFTEDDFEIVAREKAPTANVVTGILTESQDIDEKAG
jgi:hypothetical protein